MFIMLYEFIIMHYECVQIIKNMALSEVLPLVLIDIPHFKIAIKLCSYYNLVCYNVFNIFSIF